MSTSAQRILEEALRLSEDERVTVANRLLKSVEPATSAEQETATVVGHSLDHLVGVWSEEEAAEFLEATKDFGSIDEDLWA